MIVKTSFQEENYEITLLGKQALRITMSGFLKLANLVAVTSFMEMIIVEHRIAKLMVDQSNLKVLTKDVQDHLTQIISKMNYVRMKKVAIVEAKDLFARRAQDKLNAISEVSSNTKIFDCEDKALDWLVSIS